MAKKNYDAALSVNPKDPFTISSYAASLSESGDLTKAFEMIAEANELSPKNPKIMAAYGKLYLQDKQLVKAQYWLERAERSGGRAIPETYEYLGDLYQAKKDVPNAKEYWRKALEYGGKKSALKKKIDAL